MLRALPLLSPLLLTGLFALAAPEPAAACTAECATEVGCFGGCSITAPDPCGDLCWGGCRVVCRLIGPSGFGCDAGVEFDCEEGPPPAAPAPGAPQEWAVLEVWPPGGAPPERRNVVPVAYSSPLFGEYAAERVLESLRDEGPGRFRDPSRSGPEAALGSALRLFIGRGTGGGVAAEISLLTRELPFEAEAGDGIFFRAVTDGGGRIADLRVLHSRSARRTEELRTFARDHLRVSSPGRPAAVLRFYGYLGVVGDPPGAWALAAGAQEVAAVLAPGPERRRPDG